MLGFAASAFAIHAEIPSETQAVVAAGGTQITLGGELRIRGWYYSDIQIAEGPSGGLFLPTKQVSPSNTDTSYLDERVRLSLDAKVTPNVEGFVQVETNKGGSANTDSYIWGNFNSTPSDLRILQAWIMHSGAGLLGIPAGIKIGHMPLALGEKEFFDHTKFGDDAVVLFALPTKEIEVDLLKVKFTSNIDTSTTSGSHAISQQTDNTDGYVAILTYKIDDKNTIGINNTYLNNSFGDPLINGPAPAGPQITDNFKMDNIEVHASGNISGFGYKLEGDYQLGSVNLPPGNKLDFKGWSAMLGLNYMVDPVNIRVSGATGSGARSNISNLNEFITFLGQDQHYTLIYDYNIATAALVNGIFNKATAANGGRYTGLSNTSYANIGFDVKPVKDLTASLDGYWLYATNTGGWETVVGHSVSHQIGWEVDGRAVYNVAKNLNLQLDGGYFAAGTFYDDAYGSLTGFDKSSSVWLLKHTVTLSF